MFGQVGQRGCDPQRIQPHVRVVTFVGMAVVVRVIVAVVVLVAVPVVGHVDRVDVLGDVKHGRARGRHGFQRVFEAFFQP